ncbi:MAG: hypothetical protein BM555_00110 [Crocinitomix sp. MedPE-SWsnd]|nr:MAG: hypothetical protein BM555_00110 [Crocinitomix sp. MedPE-SWsnd]
MMKLLIYSSLFFFPVSGLSQSVDFGIEVNQNYNNVETFAESDIYSETNRALGVLDIGGDTINTYFFKFTMDNHVEVPLYLRFNLRKRWFADLKLSNSVNKLQMWGVSNYTDSYFRDEYGTFDEFQTNAASTGFTADTVDYIRYIDNAKSSEQASLRTVEEFKLLSYTANFGMRFFPHKSVKAFVAIGTTVKLKYGKHLYNYLDYSRDFIQDLSSVDRALDKYAERSTYFNFQAGLEFYRFRASAYVQTGVTYTFFPQAVGPEVVYTNNATPFDIIRTYGFSLSANLFSMDIGRRIKKDEVSEDDVVISNIKKKKERFDIGIRYDRRVFNDMGTYFNDPMNQLSVIKRDSGLYSSGGTFQDAVNVEMITLGDIKRIDWGARISGILNIYLTKRIGIRGQLGGSKMEVDVQTNELKATILTDSLGVRSYAVEPGTPRLRSAVYRKVINVLDISVGATYKVIDRDLFSLALSADVGMSGLLYVNLAKDGHPPGINELGVYNDFDAIYRGANLDYIDLYEGEMDVNLHEAPGEFLDKFDTEYTGPGQGNGLNTQAVYPVVSLGVDANIERYTIGLGLHFSTKPMDDFLLFNSSSAYFSIGYKLFKR